jgi:hypothetical protein
VESACLGEFDFPAGEFGSRAVEDGDMPDHAGPGTVRLVADGIDHSVFVFPVFIFNEFDLDQFVFFQGGFQRCQNLVGQSVFANENHGVQWMGQASQEFSLLAGKWHGLIVIHLKKVVEALAHRALAMKLVSGSVAGDHQPHRQLLTGRCAAGA